MKNPNQENCPCEDCFLSEFPGKNPRRWLKFGNGLLPALVFAMAGLFTLIFGHLANVNALRIEFLTILMLDRPTAVVPTVDHLFGYLGEPNHGLHVLLIAPTFIWLSFAFLQSVSRGFRQLEDAGRLDDNRGQSPTAVIAQWNRHFRFVGLLLLALFVVKNFVLEWPSAIRAEQGKGADWEIGYVQALGLAAWADRFNAKPPMERAKLIGTKNLLAAQKIHEATQGMLSEYLPFVPAAIPMWKPYLTTLFVPANLEHEKDLFARGEFTLASARAARDGLLNIRVDTVGGPRKGGEKTCFWLFLALGLFLEAGFHAFAAYMVIKALFWLVLIYLCLPGGLNCRLFLTPLLSDPTSRYGFYPLHVSYNLLVYLIAVGGFLFALANLNSIGPVVDLSMQGLNSNVGRSMIFGAVLTLALVVIIGPLILFHSKLSPVRQQRSREIILELDGSTREKSVILERELDTVRNQKTWPRHDQNFWFAALAVIAFLAMPWASIVSKLPFDAQRYVNFAVQTKSGANALCSWLYFNAPAYPATEAVRP